VNLNENSEDNIDSTRSFC